MKRVGLLSLVSVLVLGLFLVMALGSSEPSGVDTGSGDNNQGSNNKQDAKTFAVNDSITVNGLKITIGEIKIESKKVYVGMTLNNTSNAKLTFYPDQGNAVIGSAQLDANMFMTEGKLSGDILAGVQKSGVVVFTTDTALNIQEVKEIVIDFGKVYHDDWQVSAKDAKVSITVP